MDITLEKYCEIAEAFNNLIEESGMLLNVDFINNEVTQLKKNIRIIQGAVYRIADIANNGMVLLKNKAMMSQRQLSIETVDTYPTENDYAALVNTTPPFREVAPCVRVKVRHVSTIEDIPMIHMYFVESSGVIAINLNGVIVSGNLMSADQWRPSTWIYERDKKSHSVHKPKRQMRRLGNADTLAGDFMQMNSAELHAESMLRQSQLIHDIIVYMALAHKLQLPELRNCAGFVKAQ